MKIKGTQILSLIIALIMVAGVLSSCTGLFGNSETESTQDSSGSSSESESSSENGGDSEESSSTPDDGYVEETYPSLIDGENAEFIEYADRIANGVNAYFTDPTRNSYYFENKNVGVTCDLENTKLVSSIDNKAGGNYIENTMDVFVRMTDGTTYYASQSDKDAIANIFRMGYYYYENRIE